MRHVVEILGGTLSMAVSKHTIAYVLGAVIVVAVIVVLVGKRSKK